STANNHSLDKGYTGIVSTLDKLDEIGIDHMGTARSEEEQNKVLVKDVNGIKIAFLSYTYGTNGIPVPAGKEYSVNLIDKDLILKQINLAKEQNVDIICASMHWGDEYKQKQNKKQEELADYLFQNGVDIIIGNHAHVIEPMEKRKIALEDGTEKEVFVVYALGNFISGQTIEHTKSTVILDMNIRKNVENGKITIDSINYIPVYCYDESKKNSNRYELLDIREEIVKYENNSEGKVETSLYQILKSELENIEKILGSIAETSNG
ncbi:MAG: CapA family protein, partial [Clostridia bacterium]|nr:CapA family protein [Clostridia bacterium]